jgi:hypothetical protein
MQKRSSERISSRLESRISGRYTFYPGTITDLSENGFFIQSDMCFPLQSRMDICINVKGKILQVPVELVRAVKSGRLLKGMGVKVLNSSKKHLQFVIQQHLSPVH